ncbi:MAG: quinone-dependent dihydroorotate dehydrogenase [Propionibacteriaceae bacterium]|jgi:dihydroorotate dehydrogenase|nr:quinone-dependent dihydroorotate dehydrogenase [Propionibacteriaceae bacterium]
MKDRLVTSGYEHLLRPILFRTFGGDPEAIHDAMIRLLGACASTPLARLARCVVGRPTDPVTIAGVRFPGRVGLAAGMDKDGVAARMWSWLGFGFAELGTVTAHPQPGNPTPRLFRLKRSGGLINRMGFNNHGVQALADRLDCWGVTRGSGFLGVPLGISIGKTKNVPLDQAIPDYLESLATIHRQADYIAVNVSSPNTPGLRDLQSKKEISALVGALVDRAAELDPVPLPIFVKIAPDVTDQGLDELVEAVCSAGASGLIATNTTLARTGLALSDRRFAMEAGGLSGAPLSRRARQVVARVTQSGLPVIASGGIMTVADAQAMFDLGAVAVQVFSGFIYSGPGLVAAINHRTSR